MFFYSPERGKKSRIIEGFTKKKRNRFFFCNFTGSFFGGVEGWKVGRGKREWVGDSEISIYLIEWLVGFGIAQFFCVRWSLLGWHFDESS